MRRSGALVALALAACAGHPANAPDPLAALERDPTTLVARVAALRQLRDPRPAPMHFEDERTFLANLGAQAGPADAASDLSSKGGAVLAFGLGPAAVSHGSGAAAVLEEQVVAFYDERTHVIHVRRHPPVSGRDPVDPTWVVAHEVGHSLQYQNFAMPDLERIDQEDTLLAVRAVIEGDAMLAMLAYVADSHAVPLRRSLALIQRQTEPGRLEDYARRTGSSPVLLGAPPLLRERLVFPYLGGVAFMGAIYRAGGFALVDRVYQALPATTEQVLHPEKYLTGEAAIPVTVPTLPRGYQALASGRLGELQTRAVLAQCLPRDTAARAAAGWGGDAFSVGRAPGDRLAIEWATVWDSEADAEEFEQALGGFLRCSAEHASPLLAAPGSVVRRGDRVALAVGLDPASTGDAARALLDLPGAHPPAAPPLGPVTIPAFKQPIRVRPPYIAAGTWVSEHLGIRMPVPPGFTARVDGDSVFMKRDGPSLAIAAVDISDRVVTTPSLGRTFDQFADALAGALDGRELDVQSTGNADTPLGRAIERRWNVRGTRAHVRLLMLPICGGNGAIMFTQMWLDEDGKAMLDWWLASVRALANAAPPACAELDP